MRVDASGAAALRATSADLVQWVEDTLGARLVGAARQARSRPQWFVDLEGPSAVQRALIRQSREGGEANANFNKRFSITRESEILAALQGQDVKAPKIFGFEPKSRSILMEVLDGESELTEAPAEARDAIYAQYVHEMVKIHALDAAKLPVREIPKSAEDFALAKIGPMHADYLAAKRPVRPDPFLDFSMWWLRRNVPKAPPRASVLQGDCGPGQFMFKGERLVGVIDWEMAHVGDAMSDLAVMRLRNVMFPMLASVNSHLRLYEEASGRPLDRDALIYHTVVAGAMSCFALTATLQYPNPRVGWTFPGVWVDAIHRRFTCEAIAEGMGLDIEPPEIAVGRTTARTPLYDLLYDFLDQVGVEFASDENGRYQMRTAAALAAALQRADGQAAAFDADYVAEAAELTGRKRDNVADVDADLCAMIARGAIDRPDRLLRLLYRSAYRLETLVTPLTWRVSGAVGDRERWTLTPFEKLPPR